jgi:hypothetical protein
MWYVGRVPAMTSRSGINDLRQKAANPFELQNNTHTTSVYSSIANSFKSTWGRVHVSDIQQCDITDARPPTHILPIQTPTSGYIKVFN